MDEAPGPSGRRKSTVFRNDDYGGTRRFKSSNQFCTTIILGVAP
jgi:hypothetical protein